MILAGAPLSIFNPDRPVSFFESKPLAGDTYLRIKPLFPMNPEHTQFWLQGLPPSLIVFAFILCLVLIGRYFRFRREKMWHETTRLALEKGQPLPANWSEAHSRCGRGGASWDIRRGLVLIAVGAALAIALHPHERLWAAVPGFIGIAFLLFGLFASGRSGSSGSNRDLPDKK